MKKEKFRSGDHYIASKTAPFFGDYPNIWQIAPADRKGSAGAIFFTDAFYFTVITQSFLAVWFWGPA